MTRGIVRIVGAALAAGALLGATGAPAGAWPIPLTDVDYRFLNATRGVFPGDDDQLLLAGRQICRLLYTGQHNQDAIDAMVGQYGATPDQAAVAVRAARSTYCTQAPG
jgi:hypothetical protein